MANDIDYFDSSETGAPVLNNVAGSLDAVLHACLVAGFNVRTGASIAVASGLATLTLNGHNMANGRVIEVSGASPAALNGRHLATVTGANTLTFPAVGVPDGASAGVTIKRPGLGWSRPYNSGNVSIYQRTDPVATTMCLRVDDSHVAPSSSVRAAVKMAWGVSDINTWAHEAPAQSQRAGGLYWGKGGNSAAAKPWVLVGDGRTFWFFTDDDSYPASSYSNLVNGPFHFGDVNSFRAGDPFAALLMGADSSGGIGNLGRISILGTSGDLGICLARPVMGIGSLGVAALMVGPSNGGMIGGGGPAYPSPADNGMTVMPSVLISEFMPAFNNPLRGSLRGLGAPLASIPARALHLAVLDSVIGSDRRWLMVAFQARGGIGHLAFDLTGPW
jgi:hypothetical protein